MGRTEFTMPHPYVDFDNEAFARQAVARLVEQGRDRLSMILPDDKFTFCQHLRYGFVSAAREAGVAHEVLEGVTLDSDREENLGRAQCLPAPPGAAEPVSSAWARSRRLMTMAAMTDAGAYPRDRGRYLRQARLADLRQ